MIPLRNFENESKIEISKYSSNSYKINEDKERIKDYVKDKEAIKQTIYKTLRTERYKFEIYDWSFGIELEDLFGKEKGYVKGELIGRISEALLVDDRITEVYDFSFRDIDKTTIEACFKVKTDFGEIEERLEIRI